MDRKQMEVDSAIISIEEFVKKDGEKVVLRPKVSTPLPKSGSRAEEPKEDKLSNLLEINRDNVLRGIIFSEILGSPRARRKR